MSYIGKINKKGPKVNKTLIFQRFYPPRNEEEIGMKKLLALFFVSCLCLLLFFPFLSDDRNAANNQLVSCANKGDILCAGQKIKQGADVNYSDGLALRYAVHNDDLEMLNFLLGQGADFKNNEYEAFRLACDRGHYRIVQRMIQLGAKKNAFNNYCVEVIQRNLKYENKIKNFAKSQRLEKTLALFD